MPEPLRAQASNKAPGVSLLEKRFYIRRNVLSQTQKQILRMYIVSARVLRMVLPKRERNMAMYAWKVRLIEKECVGSRAPETDTTEGYAKDDEGLFIVVDDLKNATRFDTIEDAEKWRDKWRLEFEAQSGTAGVECVDIYVSCGFELVEL